MITDGCLEKQLKSSSYRTITSHIDTIHTKNLKFDRKAVPELPEVETMVRGIRPIVEGSTIQSLKKSLCLCKPIVTHPKSLRTLQARLRGRKVLTVGRLGKRILWNLDSEETLVIEPRMTGLMVLDDPPDKEHLRLQWELTRNNKRAFVWFWDRRGLGQLALYSQVEFKDRFLSGQLGHDALEMPLDEWRNRCAATKREIKVALLDQKWIAGIGNIYASEILHQACVHPQQPTNTIAETKIRQLRQCTLKVLETAIKYEGSTLNDATYRNALNKTGQYQNYHRVYNRQGDACKRCRTSEVVRIVQAQRATFFCPNCQQLE